MGTRSIWTFAEMSRTPPQEMHVYKHWDGYPTGAVAFIVAAFLSGKAWPLPRWEANEFGAAFIAANKEGDGDFRLATSRHEAADVEYGYTLSATLDGTLMMRAVHTHYWDEPEETLLFEGTLSDFLEKFAKDEESGGQMVPLSTCNRC